MNRSKVLLFLMLILLFPVNVLAEENEIVFSCYDEVMIGNQVKCKIELNSQNKVKGVMGSYQFDSSFSYFETDVSLPFEKVMSNNKGFTAFNMDGVQSGEVASLSLVVSNAAVIGNEYKIGLNDIVLSNGELDINLVNKEEVVKILSVKDIVNDISVGDNKLEVKDGITDYTVEVDSTVKDLSINVNLKGDKYKFVEGYGSRVVSDLKIGDNVYKVKIMDQNDNLLITYFINVNVKKVVLEEVEDEEIIENPPTGNTIYIIMVLVALFVSVVVIFNYKKVLGGRKDV